MKFSIMAAMEEKYSLILGYSSLPSLLLSKDLTVIGFNDKAKALFNESLISKVLDISSLEYEKWVEVVLFGNSYQYFVQKLDDYLKMDLIVFDNEKRLLEDIFKNSLDVIVVKDWDGNFVKCNEVVAGLYGTTPEEMVGKEDSFFTGNKEQGEFFKENVRNIMSKGEQEIVHEDSTNAETGEVRNFKSIKTPIINQKGEKEIIVIAQDVTDVVQLQKKAEDQLALSAHQAKLASIGELAAGVGHEINNPLAIAKGNLDLIKRMAKKGKELSEEILNPYFEKIENSNKRIAKIVMGLRSFARVDDEEKKCFSFLDALEESIEMVKKIYENEGVTISFSPDENLRKFGIKGLRGSTQQVYINFLSNAKDAVESTEKKEIHIDIIKENDSIVMTFSDTGKGIPTEIKNRIFDPFFTTKEVNKGTGIGLSISEKIIQEMDGRLYVEDRKGGGTTFKLKVPCCEIELKKEEKKELLGQEKLLGTILLVDDEDGIREALGGLLEDFGLTVYYAKDGKEALSIYLENQAQIDLILSDMKMPVMDGVTFLKEIRSNNDIKEQPKFIFITGGVQVDFEGKDKELTKLIDGYLYKPFNPETIYQVLVKAMIKNQ